MNTVLLAGDGVEVAKTAVDAVITAMSDVFTLSGNIITQITGQPILLFCLAASLVPVGIGIFRSLMNVARG
ncbi:hypothetical protein [Gemmiger formicilis]|jgi:hypothetical protein|uniref:hypothetical protein n=1 Tax=Gemmiger formicilis TaxID=745368 RepID=UPI00241D8244|nr:hypothetical protein [Gemmiger formicilis]UYJ34887.1 MAG: hypothetical protein OGM67_00610 [Oscillospiraceae bacterium]